MKTLVLICLSVLLIVSCRQEHVDPALGQGPYILGNGSVRLKSTLDSLAGSETRYQYDDKGRVSQIVYGRPGCTKCIQTTRLTYKGDSIYWESSDSVKVWQRGHALVQDNRIIRSVLEATVPGSFSYSSTDSTLYFYAGDKLIRTEKYTRSSDMRPNTLTLRTVDYQFAGELVSQSADWTISIENGIPTDSTGGIILSYLYSDQNLSYNPAMDVFPIPGFCALHIPKAVVRIEPLRYADISMAAPLTPVDYNYQCRGTVPLSMTARSTVSGTNVRRTEIFTY